MYDHWPTYYVSITKLLTGIILSPSFPICLYNSNHLLLVLKLLDLILLVLFLITFCVSDSVCLALFKCVKIFLIVLGTPERPKTFLIVSRMPLSLFFWCMKAYLLFC